MSPSKSTRKYSSDCPFCKISRAFPSSTSSTNTDADTLRSCIADDVDATKIDPACYLVLSAPEVLAFLDIMPMTSGHLLVTTRRHNEKIGDVSGSEGRDIGFWLPILSRVVMKVVEATDYNIVQNNGARAAQVVPHVHFHIIPRPESVPNIQSRSWTMFGRGQREDLDEEEAEQLVDKIRTELRNEVENIREKSTL